MDADRKRAPYMPVADTEAQGIAQRSSRRGSDHADDGSRNFRAGASQFAQDF